MKTVTLYGADHKVGVTMLSQSIAEVLALALPEQQIVLLHFDGRPGIEYTHKISWSEHGLENLKAALLSGVLTGAEIKAACAVSSKITNLYQLSGICSYKQRREFNPDYVKKMLDLLCEDGIDLVVIDAGSNWELGLSIGSLQHSNYNFLVSTQQHSAQSNHLATASQIFSVLAIKFDYLLLNKYQYHPQFKGMEAALETYNLTAGANIPYSDFGWQAEAENETLLCYKETEYRQSIGQVAHYICLLCNMETALSAGTEPKRTLLGLWKGGSHDAKKRKRI